MNDEEAQAAFTALIENVARSSAQLSARMALAMSQGVSPNQVETWVHQTIPLQPLSWPDTLKMSKMILEVATFEVKLLAAFKEGLR